MPRTLILAAAAAVLLTAAPALAQEHEAPPADSTAAADTIPSSGEAVASTHRPRGRWSTPFAVEGNGRATIERDPRPEVVRWDAPRRPASPAAATPPATPAVSPDSAAPVEGDSATSVRPARTAAGRDSARTTTRPATPAAPTTGRTATNAATTRTPPRPRTHTVAPGETFYGIARRYGLTADQLRAANPDARWESVRIGEELRIPPARGATTTATRETPRRTAAARRVHVVERGETLFGIARRYGVRPRQIQEANDMAGDQVRIGQRLVIPAS